MIQIHPDSEIISDLSHFCGSIYEDLQVSHHIARKKNHPMVKSLEFDEFDQGLGTIEMRRGQTWPHQQLSWPQRLGILENG